MSERSLADSHGQIGMLLTLSAVGSRRHSYHSQVDSAWRCLSCDIACAKPSCQVGVYEIWVPARRLRCCRTSVRRTRFSDGLSRVRNFANAALRNPSTPVWKKLTMGRLAGTAVRVNEWCRSSSNPRCAGKMMRSYCNDQRRTNHLGLPQTFLGSPTPFYGHLAST